MVTDFNFFDSLHLLEFLPHCNKGALCHKISGPHRNDAARCAMESEEIQKKENYLLF